MTPIPINLTDKLSLFTERWSPKIVAQMDGYHFKLAKLEGDFVWHKHTDTDEAFIILRGQLRIDFRDGAVTLNQGEMLIVPTGVEHKPYAELECHLMILVRADTVNTGDAHENELTADTGAWIWSKQGLRHYRRIILKCWKLVTGGMAGSDAQPHPECEESLLVGQWLPVQSSGYRALGSDSDPEESDPLSPDQPWLAGLYAVSTCSPWCLATPTLRTLLFYIAPQHFDLNAPVPIL